MRPGKTGPTIIGLTQQEYRVRWIMGENQILIAGSCYQHVKESFKCREIGELALKNKAGKLTVYEVLE